MIPATTTLHQTSPRARVPWLSLSAIAIASVLALPILVIMAFVIYGDTGVWGHLLATVLPDYVSNTLTLMIGVGFGVLILGVPSAWLTSTCEFPGRRVFVWALLLPLAVPGYIIAYTYTGLLDFAGPVQSALREVTGLGYGEYWFFEIRSLAGAIIMLSLVLYPYVYLLARAAFLEQSVSTIEVSRTLGLSVPRAFVRIAIPLARPAIVAGLTLALMETVADYGTVQFFGVDTFTTGIFRAFYGFGDSPAAAQLAASLLVFVAVLVLIERHSRRRARYFTTGKRNSQAKPITLRGVGAAGAFIVCAIPLTFGFLLPATQLGLWAVIKSEPLGVDFLLLIWHSFSLALVAAGLAVALALVLAYAQRRHATRTVSSAVTVASLGYALPGTIIAIGVLIPFAWLDHRLIDIAQKLFNFDIGLVLSGTIVALLFAYCVRFLAVSLGAVQTGLGKIKPSLDEAALSLGQSALSNLRSVHVPLMRSSVLTAVLIVFVDVLKELPATLILRPFNYNTLAVRAYELASDERLADAAPASLTIVIVGLAPVILLSRSIAASRNTP